MDYKAFLNLGTLKINIPKRPHYGTIRLKTKPYANNSKFAVYM